jgi:hypothetical protein
LHRPGDGRARHEETHRLRGEIGDVVTANRMTSTLRSARFARGTLLFLAAYAGVAAWLPWTLEGGPPPPGWASAVGLDHPFSAIPFLLACGALFASTLACTWGRRARIAALRRGELPASAVVLGARPDADAAAFLRSQGFRGAGPVMVRHPLALWGGWILHLGLVVLVAAVVVQQAFHDGGAFELTEGEQASLAQAGIVFGRERGVLVRAGPPDLTVGLLSFDPFLHQRGYAPDRASRILVQPGGARPIEATVDRADGLRVGSTLVYQAIPSGVALVVDVAGAGRRSIHLASSGERSAAASVIDPAGDRAAFSVEAEHGLADRRGTGALTVKMDGKGGPRLLAPGAPFEFGGIPARLVAVSRWSGFTYTRSPGMPGIFAGFALVLAGALLLVFPAAVARLSGPGDGAAARLAGRGAEVLVRRWQEAAAPPRPLR